MWLLNLQVAIARPQPRSNGHATMTDAPRSFARLLLVLAAMAAPAVQAQENSPRFEPPPCVGYRFGGDFDLSGEDDTASSKSIDLDDAASFGLDLGLYRDSHSFYKLLYSRPQRSL